MDEASARTGKRSVEYNLRFRNPSGQWVIDDALRSSESDDDMDWNRARLGADCHQVSRTVVEWGDGTALFGPWEPL